MPDPNDTRTNVSRKLLGAAFLTLIFVASATAAAEYLGTKDESATETQTAAALVPTQSQSDAFSNLDLQAKAVYVQDLSTGVILYRHNAGVPLPLASLTKIAMALAVSEVLPPDSVITIPYDAQSPDSPEHLSKGQQWLLRDVLSFTLIASSNDGAEILASAANAAVHARYPDSPATDAVLWRMNELVHSLGLHDMYFLNVSGLDVGTTQAGAFGSAEDVAHLIAYAASTTPATFEGTARGSMLLTSVQGAQARAYNTDKALGSIPGLIMGKTGYTDLAGGNLAVLFDVGPAHPVVAVVLGSTYDGRFADMKKLVDAAHTAIQLSP